MHDLLDRRLPVQDIPLIHPADARESLLPGAYPGAGIEEKQEEANRGR